MNKNKINEIIEIEEQKFIKKISGDIKSVCYDTIFASLLEKDNIILFPNSRSWIIKNQHSDGSWGSTNFSYFDRLVSTSGVLAYCKKYLPIEAYDKGIKWLKNNISIVFSGKIKYTGIGFSYILPTHLSKISNVLIDNKKIQKFNTKYKKKIQDLPIERLIALPNQFNFMLEIFDDEILKKDLSHLIGENGSIACSVAATSRYLSFHLKDSNANKMIKYLSEVQNDDGGFPHLIDIEYWNILWFLLLMYKINPFHLNNFKAEMQKIKSTWGKFGIGYSENFPEADSDDSAVALLLLEEMDLISIEDRENYWSSIKFYEGEKWYETYINRFGKSSGRKLNIDGSSDIRWTVSVNLHLLDLFIEHGHKRDDQAQCIDKLITLFKNVITDDGLDSDRWHYSPAYNNSHGILTFNSKFPIMSKKCLNYFITTQNEQGLWSNQEETIFALLGILYYNDYVEKVPEFLYKPGIDFIINNYNPKENPELWTGKVLYQASSIIHAHYIALLHLIKNRI